MAPSQVKVKLQDRSEPVIVPINENVRTYHHIWEYLVEKGLCQHQVPGTLINIKTDHVLFILHPDGTQEVADHDHQVMLPDDEDQDEAQLLLAWQSFAVRVKNISETDTLQVSRSYTVDMVRQLYEKQTSKKLEGPLLFGETVLSDGTQKISEIAGVQLDGSDVFVGQMKVSQCGELRHLFSARVSNRRCC